MAVLLAPRLYDPPLAADHHVPQCILKARCKEDGVEAELWNALAISFTGDMPLHRDAQNRRGTHNFLYCAGKFSGGELRLQDAEAVSKGGSRQPRPQPFTWQDESNPEGLPGYKVSAKDRLVKFDAKGRAMVAYSARTLGEPLAGSALRLGFGSHYTFSSTEERLAEAVLLCCSPRGDGPKPESLRVRLTNVAIAHSMLYGLQGL